MSIYWALFSCFLASAECLRLLPAADVSCTPLHVDPIQCSPYLSADGKTMKPPLLVVSLDGFRSNYFDRLTSSSPNGLLRLARCGVKAASMVPVFPTLTLPNHYSIVTGLYPESHGIVAHEFYDPDLGRNFSLPAAGFNFSAANLLDPLWWKGEPIWYTIKRQGKVSASYFWPGSYIDDPVRRPNYWLPYNASVPFQQRITQVVNWLLLPVSQRPNFIGLYLDEPDSSGHDSGPDSAKVEEKIRFVDSQIELLIDTLAINGIIGCVDIIVLSDHGMASIPIDRNVVQLEEMVNDITTTAYCFDCAEGTTSTLRAVNDSQMERDRIASGLQCRNKDVRIYDKWDFPRRHHYASSRRISDLIFDLGNTWRAVVGVEDYLPGGHGWDNVHPDMQASFVAQGPSFRRDGSTVDPFYNIDLYNLMCFLTGVDPAPNNGTWGALHHLLATQPPVQSADGNDSTAVAEMLAYPDEAQYDERLENRRTCDLLSGKNDPAQDSSLNLTQSVAEQSVSLHTPWGFLGSTNEDIKILVSHDFIVGFNVQDGIPSWVSYSVSNYTNFSEPSAVPWRLDVRLRVQDISICDRLSQNKSDSVLLTNLFFAEFTSSPQYSKDTSVETNAIEMSPAFERYWQDIGKRISGLAGKISGKLNVVTGPVRNSPSPAIFLVISFCRGSIEANCSNDQLDVQSFIFPTHLQYSSDCLAKDLFARSHLATVRDVERASGLVIFPSLSHEDKVQLLARTILASKLLVDPLTPDDDQSIHNSAGQLISAHSVSHWFFMLLAAIFFTNRTN